MPFVLAAFMPFIIFLLIIVVFGGGYRDSRFDEPALIPADTDDLPSCDDLLAWERNNPQHSFEFLLSIMHTEPGLALKGYADTHSELETPKSNVVSTRHLTLVEPSHSPVE